MKRKKKEEMRFRTNSEIRATEVRLVGNNVEPGVYSKEEAQQIADDNGLDLIEINGKADVPICKVDDYSKFLYNAKKKKKEQEKKTKQNRVDVKEIRFTPNTDKHDFDFKKKHAENFLKKGDKVKAFVFFRGREMNFKEKGEILLLRFADELSEYGTVERMPKMEGNRMILILKPKK